MQDAHTIRRIGTTYDSLALLMDERMRRQWAAAEATAYGWGGIQAVACATGLSPTTIRKGQAEVAHRSAHPAPAPAPPLRRPGAGRKRKTVEDAELVQALEELVHPVTRGDPHSPLRWTCKSTPLLPRQLTGQAHPASHPHVPPFLPPAH